MGRTIDWWSESAFIRDYFLDGRRKVAHELAAYLARYYVGESIADLRPDTNVSALIADSIRRFIHMDDFTMVRDDDPLADIDLKESISFDDVVTIVHSQRSLSA
ncbi:MAG: hypothetical protein JSS24_08290 [Proteobacteria bacterium]|nr:hypothetical protein [Pseudomonadota bacterium]